MHALCRSIRCRCWRVMSMCDGSEWTDSMLQSILFCNCTLSKLVMRLAWRRDTNPLTAYLLFKGGAQCSCRSMFRFWILCFAIFHFSISFFDATSFSHFVYSVRFFAGAAAVPTQLHVCVCGSIGLFISHKCCAMALAHTRLIVFRCLLWFNHKRRTSQQPSTSLTF